MQLDEGVNMEKMNNMPRSLKYDSERERRNKMINLPHIAPLTRFVDEIRTQGYDVPYFDPCDGGIEAKALFLLQDPGKKAIKSGFISRNNDDQSAENQLKFQKEAGLNRKSTILWNIIPWRVGNVTADDRKEAIPYLKLLLNSLPRLKVIVLSGSEAWKCHSQIQSITHITILETYHTGNRGLNSQGKREEFISSVIDCYRKAAGIIASDY